MSARKTVGMVLGGLFIYSLGVGATTDYARGAFVMGVMTIVVLTFCGLAWLLKPLEEAWRAWIDFK